MSQELLIKSGTFTGAAAAVTVDLGFLPDIFEWWMNETIAATNLSSGKWDRTMGAAKGLVRVCVADSGTTGNLSENYLASAGITLVDTTVKQPDRWKASTVYAVGDIVHPTTNNGYFYKCSTAGTSHTAEPASWGTTPGGTTSEGGGTVVWTCYAQGDLPVQRTKVQGVSVDTGAMTNAKVYRYKATRTNA